MEVIPAIDLLNGQCVRLVQGDYAQAEVVGTDPMRQAQLWAELGATRLHLVDLTGAKAGTLVHHQLIAAITRALPCPVQVGGGIRSLEQITSLLDQGVDRVIVGTLALENPALVREACRQYPNKIWLALDCRHGKIATKGWLEQTTVDALTLAQEFEAAGAAGFIYTDILQDGTLKGPNIPELRRVSTHLDRPVIASGGMGSMTDLLNLLPLVAQGVTGVILGKALYQGTITLPEALRAVRWQDVPETDIRFC